MAAVAGSTQHSRIFKIGWILLLIGAGLMALNHAVLIFVLDEPTLFAGYTVFNLYALAVLLIPFRRGERWAWICSWLLPLGLTAPALLNGDIAAIYYAVAALCAAGLLLTGPQVLANKEVAA
ncbi:MAG: hypothetical protein U0X20_15815 [Caldilineaceae bacterium]